MPVLQDNKSPIEKIVHEPKDNYMLKLYFLVVNLKYMCYLMKYKQRFSKIVIFTLLNCDTLKAILHNAHNFCLQ